MGFILLMLNYSNTEAKAIVNDSLIKNSDSIYNYLNDSIKINSYIGRSVEELLDEVPFELQKYLYTRTSNPLYISGAYLKYSEKCWIKIEIYEFNYLNQYDIEESWSFDLFKKETISNIKLIYREVVSQP